MTPDEVKNEIITQGKSLQNVPDELLNLLYKLIPLITKLDIKKLSLDYSRYDECIVIWLNLHNDILVSIDIDICDDLLYTFSIFHCGELLVWNELPVYELINKLLNIQFKLKNNDKSTIDNRSSK